MGIKGLTSFLEKDFSYASFEPLPESCHFVIDGYGWMFHLLRSVDRLEPLGRHRGGGYDTLHRTIEYEVNFLRTTFDCQLSVFFDGSKSKLKQHTHLDRMKQREVKWENMQKFHENGTAFAPNDLPIAPLCPQQMRTSLTLLEIPIIISSSEADCDMAKFAYEWECAHNGSAYCIAEDSDFMALKHCNYIRFRDISSYTDYRYNPHHQRLLPIYRRDTIARRLSLTTAQFIEWCILIGNDYTGHYTKNHFHNSLTKYHNSDCKHATLREPNSKLYTNKTTVSDVQRKLSLCE